MIVVEHLTVVSKKEEILKDVSISIKKGQIVGFTGHSGSGKTTFIKAIMGILSKGLEIKEGKLHLNDYNLLQISNKQRRQICGTTIGFIPQNPMTAFDKRMKIGVQVKETLKTKLKINDKCMSDLIEAIFKKVNLSDIDRVLNSYPSQLSGGMLQRVAIALILGLNPEYILADEPTSALDDENRKLVIKILKELSSKVGILFISHDVDALKELSESVHILEKGKIIEIGTMESILYNPKTQWTKEFSKLNNIKSRREWQWKAL